jgi:hypothetical protein
MRKLWEDNIKMVTKTGCKCVNWRNVVQDRDKFKAVVKTVMNLRVSKNAGNFLSG